MRLSSGVEGIARIEIQKRLDLIQDWCILFYPIHHGFGSWIEPSITTSSTHPVCCPFGSVLE
ncbi:hypothetical protein PVK06_007236 [Gossypium arboreum]|uniref:Uncharacterized protein n=1 Tax=Gossypium arboreum TaxID=29729 RepID=A0ABR0QHJ4_GOSAR|nr:hypothetical protein PVK06_007236 [Gossypium arboreum]